MKLLTKWNDFLEDELDIETAEMKAAVTIMFLSLGLPCLFLFVLLLINVWPIDVFLGGGLVTWFLFRKLFRRISNES